jgi:hypothetical protein
MTKRLLDRQASLLDYLTSGNAIFGGVDHACRTSDLEGIDGRLLHLEARFSHEKRMEKVLAVFPKTFDILGDRAPAVIREFAEACPPTDISRLVNALQFHDFLSTLAVRRLEPPHLLDVAACELACAKVRAAIDDQAADAPKRGTKQQRGLIRRGPAVALLHCAYDVRPIFEGRSSVPSPDERDTALAVAMPTGAGRPQIFELMPIVYELLAALEDWTDPQAFGDTSEVEDIIVDLIEHGLVEVEVGR